MIFALEKLVTLVATKYQQRSPLLVKLLAETLHFFKKEITS